MHFTDKFDTDSDFPPSIYLERRRESAEIARDVQDFLDRGGEILVLTDADILGRATKAPMAQGSSDDWSAIEGFLDSEDEEETSE